ncbi:MAG: hypothetical protein ABI348_09670 [Nitrososphaera sp.]
MESGLTDFCYRVLDLDKGIRFAGFASNSGKLTGFAYRRGLKPLASKEESESSILSTFSKMDTRAQMEKRYGKTIYTFALYQNVRRVMIPIRNSSKITHVFMVSFDTDVNQEPIVMNEIIPRLEDLFVQAKTNG